MVYWSHYFSQLYKHVVLPAWLLHLAVVSVCVYDFEKFHVERNVFYEWTLNNEHTWLEKWLTREAQESHFM